MGDELIALCQICHKPFIYGKEGDGYTCFECRDDLEDNVHPFQPPIKQDKK